jgi:hypothetical protein
LLPELTADYRQLRDASEQFIPLASILGSADDASRLTDRGGVAGDYPDAPKTERADCKQRIGSTGRRRAGVVCAAQLSEEVMTLLCSSRIVPHHLLEEVRNVILTGVSGITNVLTVVVPGFERVILHRNQIEGYVVEPCLASSHS